MTLPGILRVINSELPSESSSLILPGTPDELFYGLLKRFHQEFQLDSSWIFSWKSFKDSYQNFFMDTFQDFIIYFYRVFQGLYP